MDVVSIGETMAAFEPDKVGKLRSIQNFSRFAGGAETNTMIALSRLGFQTKWISFLGNDEFGQFILNEVRGEGVDVSDVRLIHSGETGVFFIERSAVEDCKSIYYRQNSSFRQFGPQDVDKTMISGAKILHLTGITPCLSKSCYEATLKIIDIAKKNNVKIVFDANLRLKLVSIEEAREIIIPILSKCDIAIPNNTEMDLLFPGRTYREVADELLEKGVEVVVVKKGAEGAAAYTKHDTFEVDAYKMRDIASTMGAGDAFNSGFIAGLLQNNSVRECLLKASAMGSFAIRGYDPYRMLPTKAELENFISGRNEIVR